VRGTRAAAGLGRSRASSPHLSRLAERLLALRWPLNRLLRRGVLYGVMTGHWTGTKWSWALAAGLFAITACNNPRGPGSADPAATAQAAMMSHFAAEARRITGPAIAEESSGEPRDAVLDRRLADLRETRGLEPHRSRPSRTGRLGAGLIGPGRWRTGSLTIPRLMCTFRATSGRHEREGACHHVCLRSRFLIPVARTLYLRHGHTLGRPRWAGSQTLSIRGSRRRLRSLASPHPLPP